MQDNMLHAVCCDVAFYSIYCVFPTIYGKMYSSSCHTYKSSRSNHFVLPGAEVAWSEPSVLSETTCGNPIIVFGINSDKHLKYRPVRRRIFFSSSKICSSHGMKSLHGGKDFSSYFFQHTLASKKMCEHNSQILCLVDGRVWDRQRADRGCFYWLNNWHTLVALIFPPSQSTLIRRTAPLLFVRSKFSPWNMQMKMTYSSLCNSVATSKAWRQTSQLSR